MKKLIFVLSLFITTTCCAELPINQKYSFKDFSNMVMTDYDPKEFNDSIIVGSCFYQEGVPNRHIFPEVMEGVIFRRCNLDNVWINETKNIIEKEGGDDKKCSIRKIMVQNDLSDWELDDTLKPKEPLDKEERIKLGISIDPKDIPKTKMTENIVDKKRRELAEISQ